MKHYTEKVSLYKKRHRPLGSEDAIDDRVSPGFSFQNENVMHDVKDKVELRHGADQLGLEEGRPFLLQSPLPSEVTLVERGFHQNVV